METLENNVGKIYRIKGAEGSVAERRFKITKFIPKKDFGVNGGGNKPAYEVERVDSKTVHIPPAQRFLEEHEEETEQQDA